ncbi:Phage antirepressor protein KilAC domain-containing protein [Nitrosospira multiformis]|uniref:Phage antirepressor protein KilAC domain-containing protein n=1 Tax=Nitrosospira multiformis TaxID=1231 RepID=A0A1I0FGA6_9PROT|nr:Phage antirepressor protein KilAC domain-containing protein [Nitrosospira multiformis]
MEFVQKYAEAESTKCLGDVAKVLGHKPHSFSKMLASDGVIFKRDEWGFLRKLTSMLDGSWLGSG